MNELEQTLTTILEKNHESFSAMARRGYSKSGRGAIFVWETEGDGDKPFTTYRSTYHPQSDEAFLKAGAEPAAMARDYNPATELVVVFVDTVADVHTIRLALAPEGTEEQFEV
jgi:hypothetical protein